MHKFHLTIDTTRGNPSEVERYLIENGLVDHFENGLSHGEDSGEKNTMAIAQNKSKFSRYIKRKTPIDNVDPKDMILNCVYKGTTYESKKPRRKKGVSKEMGSKIPF